MLVVAVEMVGGVLECKVQWGVPREWPIYIFKQQEQVYTKKQDEHTSVYTNSCAPTR